MLFHFFHLIFLIHLGSCLEQCIKFKDKIPPMGDCCLLEDGVTCCSTVIDDIAAAREDLWRAETNRTTVIRTAAAVQAGTSEARPVRVTLQCPAFEATVPVNGTVKVPDAVCDGVSRTFFSLQSTVSTLGDGRMINAVQLSGFANVAAKRQRLVFLSIPIPQPPSSSCVRPTGTQVGGTLVRASPLAICVVQGSISGEAFVLILGLDNQEFVSFQAVRSGILVVGQFAYLGADTDDSVVIVAVVPEIEVNPNGGFVITGKLVFTPADMMGQPPFSNKRALLGHIS